MRKFYFINRWKHLGMYWNVFLFFFVKIQDRFFWYTFWYRCLFYDLCIIDSWQKWFKFPNITFLTKKLNRTKNICTSVKKATYYITHHFSDKMKNKTKKKHNQDSWIFHAKKEASVTVSRTRRQILQDNQQNLPSIHYP